MTAEGKIYFVRHGECETNVRGVFAGQRDDSPLTEKGREQARIVGESLITSGVLIDRVIASPLIRAQETAKIIAQKIGNGLIVEIDRRIIEYDMGDLTGTPLRRVMTLDMVPIVKAEEPEDFKRRVDLFFNDLSNEKGNILVVSHGGVAKMIEVRRQKISAYCFFDLKLVPNGEIIEVEKN